MHASEPRGGLSLQATQADALAPTSRRLPVLSAGIACPCARPPRLVSGGGVPSSAWRQARRAKLRSRAEIGPGDAEAGDFFQGGGQGLVELANVG